MDVNTPSLGDYIVTHLWGQARAVFTSNSVVASIEATVASVKKNQQQKLGISFFFLFNPVWSVVMKQSNLYCIYDSKNILKRSKCVFLT